MTFSQTNRKPMKRSALKPGKGFKRKGSRLKARIDPKLAAWSKAVKARDGYCRWPMCFRTGPGVTIDAHHKAPRSQRPDLRLELSNGIVLCRYHHTFTHGEGKAEAIELGILIEETYEAAAKTRNRA